METKKRKTLTNPSSRRRRRKPRSPAERRDWASLPGDVVWAILSRLPHADILCGAGLACASWWRSARDEPTLWRRIDLSSSDDEDKLFYKRAEARWQAMARAAVGRCESFRGRVDGRFLLYLADSAPLLRRLHVTSSFNFCHEETEAMKKFPLLEQFVLSSGLIWGSDLRAVVDHCPRLELLDAGACGTWRTIRKGLWQNRVKHLRLPPVVGRVGASCMLRRPNDR